MEYSSLITNDAFLKLKCDSCKNYLSAFPIYVSDADKKNICGRCSHVLQENHVQNEIYEALAQFVKFPCRYKNEGCSENVEPMDIPEHERICDFRIVKCPTRLFTECIWEEARPGYLNHCQDKHFDLMIKDYTFQLDLSQSYECTNLLEHDTFLFIVRQGFDSVNNLMKFSICHIQCEVNANEFPYEISFKSTNRTVIVQSCTTAFSDEKILDIYLHSLKEKNDSSVVIGNIKFKHYDVQVPVKEVIFEELLSPFTCVTCNEYALPPIFCQSNNSLWGEAPVICSACKEGRKSRFGEINPIECTRNFGLEKISNLLNFPCKHKRNGCGFVAKPPQMQFHLQSCLYGDHCCPLDYYCDCQWKGVGKDIVTHIVEVHSDMILNNESVITEDILNTEVTINSDSENVCNTSTLSISATGSTVSASPAACASSPSLFGVSRALVSNATPVSTPFGTNTVGMDTKRGLGFGSTSIFDTSGSRPLFGAPVPSTNSIFGAPETSTTTFGILTTASSSSSSSAFRAPITSTRSQFGAPVTSTTILGILPTSSGVFGTLETSSSTFGGTAITTTAPCNIFGAPVTTIASQVNMHKDKIKNNGSDSQSRIIRKTPKSKSTNTNTSKPNQGISKCYVIKFSNRLFRLNFAVFGEHFTWTVQMIGPFENGFMFELELVDTNNKRSSLICKQPCVSLKKIDEIFKKHGCYFFRDQIASFLSHQITFKIRLYK